MEYVFRGQGQCGPHDSSQRVPFGSRLQEWLIAVPNSVEVHETAFILCLFLQVDPGSRLQVGDLSNVVAVLPVLNGRCGTLHGSNLAFQSVSFYC